MYVSIPGAERHRAGRRLALWSRSLSRHWTIYNDRSAVLVLTSL